MTMKSRLAANDFEQILPKSLDEIFTQNRDLAKLSLATEDQIAELARIIPTTEYVTGEISDWRFIAYEVSLPGRQVVHIHPLGDDCTAGHGCQISSPVVGIDLGSRRVATHSGSIYRLLGERGIGEPTMRQLLHVCAAQWKWGRGPLFGILPVWY